MFLNLLCTFIALGLRKIEMSKTRFERGSARSLTSHAFIYDLRGALAKES